MVVSAKVCELTDGFLWFVCSLYVGILTSPLRKNIKILFLLPITFHKESHNCKDGSVAQL